MQAILTVLVLGGAVLLVWLLFGSGRALRIRIATAEGSSGPAEELIAQGTYVKCESGFSLKRPARRTAQAFTALYVGRGELVLAERGVGYRIDREDAVAAIEHGAFGRRLVIRGPRVEGRLFPADFEHVAEVLESAGWLEPTNRTG